MYFIKIILLFGLMIGVWSERPDPAIRVPLKRAGRLIYLEAVIDGQIGNLIFDSGAAGLILNKAYFTDYQTVYNTEGGGVSGSTGPLYRKKINEINLGPLQFNGLTAHLTHLGHIENKRGIKVLGLLGISILEDYEIILDVRNLSLDLIPINKSKEEYPDHQLKKSWDEILPIVYANHIVSVKLEIGGKKVPLCLDTAAEMSYLDSRSSEKVLQEINILRTVNLSGAGATSMEVLYGEVKEFFIGRQSFANFPVLIGPMKEMNQAYGLSLKGMLGFDFLQKAVININLKNEKIAIDWYSDSMEDQNK